MSSFALRPAAADDLDLAYEITREAMRTYVEATWGEWNEAEQLRKHRTHYTAQTHQFIRVAGQDAGLLALEHAATHVWLVKLYLREAFRQQGIGTQILRSVLTAADAQGSPVMLRVLRVNVRARALYERHGFVIIGQTPERFFMQRPVAAS